MARSRKSGDAPGKRPPADDGVDHAERLSRTLSDSAQQIWLAGVGAFGRAQVEGSRIFEGLVKEGLTLEKAARNFAGTADVVRDAVEARVGQARERASGTFDRLEKVFEDRVQRALASLDVPDRKEIEALRRRVDALAADAGATASPSARKAPARKATAGSTASGTPARKAAAPASSPRTAGKTAARKSTRGAAKPGA